MGIVRKYLNKSTDAPATVNFAAATTASRPSPSMPVGTSVYLFLRTFWKINLLIAHLS